MSNTADRLVFQVTHSNRKSGETTVAGKWVFDSHMVITQVSAEPAFQKMLDMTAREVNEMQGVHVEAQPPADAEDHAVYTRLVGRDDPAFIDALREHLRTYHNLDLTPA